MAETWIDLRNNADVKIPGDLLEPINDAIDAINTAIDVVRFQLEVALDILKAARAFLLAFLDPLVQIINLIIAIIRQLYEEIEAAGIYLNGDWDIISPDMRLFQGGYKEFERRMVARLTDPRDPTRPQIPSATRVWAVFLYLGVDFSEIYRLVQLLQQLLRLFRIPGIPKENLGQPINLSVKYGVSGLPDFIQDFAEAVIGQRVTEYDEQKEIVPTLDTATLSWEMPKQPQRQGINLPNNPPSGFLISVSTLRNGIQVAYDRAVSDAPKSTNPDGTTSQKRETGKVAAADSNGPPLVIYGGVDQLQINEDVYYNNTMEGAGRVSDGSPRVYGTTGGKNDETPIPLDQLINGETRYLQRMFYISLGEMLGIPSDDWFSVSANFLVELSSFLLTYPYSYKLRAEEMPKAAVFEEEDGKLTLNEDVDPPTTYYVRIAPVSKNIRSETDFQYILAATNMRVSGQRGVAPLASFSNGDETVNPAPKDVGPWSAPIEVSFPLSGAQEYLTIVASALAVVILSRSDVPVSTENVFVEGSARRKTDLETFGDRVAKVLGSSPDTFFSFSGQAAGATSDLFRFRKQVYDAVNREAEKIYKQTGLNFTLSQAIIEAGQVLLTWKWSDTTFRATLGNQTVSPDTFVFPEKTIMQSLRDRQTTYGLARSPSSAGVYNTGRAPLGIGAAPGFFENSRGVSSVANAPGILVYENNNINNKTVVYARNLIPNEVYQAAASVLGLAVPPAPGELQGQWISFRLIELFPELGKYVEMVISWLEGLKEGLKNIVDSIIRYIDFLEARILELMALLQRIDALGDLLFTFEVPGFEVLFVSTRGSDGLLADFITAEGKPDDSEALSGEGPQSILPDGSANRDGIEAVEDTATSGEFGSSLLQGFLGTGNRLDVGSFTDLGAYKVDDGAGILSAASTGLQTNEEGELERVPPSRFAYGGGAVLLATSLPSLVIDLLELLFNKTIAEEEIQLDGPDDFFEDLEPGDLELPDFGQDIPDPDDPPAP